MSTAAEQSLLERWRGAAPVLALALLLLPAAWSPRAARTADDVARHRAIARAVESMPYRIDGWVGSDVPVPGIAKAILQPNALLSRRYERIGNGEGATIVIVHCADARTMFGHHPSVCYPNAGWTGSADAVRTVDLSPWPARSLPMHEYRFSRLEQGGVERTVRVYACFVLPGGVVVDDLAAAQRRTERLSRSLKGLTQVQVVVENPRTTEVSDRTVAALLEAARPLLHDLGLHSP